MTRSKRVGAYPKQMLEIAGKFEGVGATRRYVLECVSERAAKAMSLDFYAFKGALRAEGLAADYPTFDLVRITRDKAKLVFMHVDDVFAAKVKRR